VPVHDAGALPDGRFYYAMKLVRGRRLDEPPAVPADLGERLQLFQRICEAVAFAHAHGVIHRDLKPQNIMLGAFGEVLVLDWGLAKGVGEAAPPSAQPHDNGPVKQFGQTCEGTVLGTPGFMAPEQAHGEVRQLDERADVYALGAILYFLLTGRPPADVSAAFQITPPRRLDRSIPRPLEAVCMRALAVDRSVRYASVADLGGEVGNFLAQRRVRAYPEGPVGAALRLANKYRAVIALIGAYLVMRILLLLFAGP